ncbi:metallophosphoesterase [Lysobacter spongiae]|uniref:Metallophosphoesterase n=2 Tax=Marilutibacter spongiae TaxID=2025720 RepID=A0A7W3TJT4_9GAMM|nr:metallophosphoesterase [Lysobacter spongiae]
MSTDPVRTMVKSFLLPGLSLLLAQAFAGVTLAAPPEASPAPAAPRAGFDDGPYIDYVDGGLVARWVCDGRSEVARFHARRWPVRVPPRCGQAAAIEVRAPVAGRERVDLRGVERLAALSDVHGQYALMVRLLQANRILDDRGDWAWGDGHLVLVGDVFDRGPRVNEIFWKLYALEQQAREAGGGLHVLLGNHEAMVLYRDLRYVNDRYFATANALGIAYTDLYGPGSVIGDWLRSRPVIARIDDMLFVHGGMSPAFLALGIDNETANDRYRASLGMPRTLTRDDPRYAPLYDGRDSPIWYRGYFDPDALDPAGMDAVLDRLGVAHVVVGHTSMAHVESHRGGRVIAVDSSIKDGESGELLFVEAGRMSRGTLAGERLPLRDATATDPVE